jgi:2-keto-3-deoxy-6-phosphogluconate aldolase
MVRRQILSLAESSKVLRAAAVGLGSKLVSAQAVKEKDYAGIAAKTAQCIAWVKAARTGK